MITRKKGLGIIFFTILCFIFVLVEGIALAAESPLEEEIALF
jgi:hypothetical protein